MLIALVTWSGLPALSLDDQLVRDELRARGAAVEACVWDDPRVAWESYDAVVIRSTWDYHKRIDEFRGWLARLDGARVWNPVPLLQWNTHKAYLRDFEAAVPTEFVRREEVEEVARRRGWASYVMKPVVSATAYATYKVEDRQSCVSGRAESPVLPFDEWMLQPFIEEVQTDGEWSLIFFSGAFSHAVLKRPRPGDFRVQNDFGGTAHPATPPESIIEQAADILAAVKEPWLYARVDGVIRGGRFLLMELEMTEPSLFLGTDAGAPRRFAEAMLSL